MLLNSLSNLEYHDSREYSYIEQLQTTEQKTGKIKFLFGDCGGGKDKVREHQLKRNYLSSS